MTETLLPEVLMPEVVMADAQIDEAVAFINERVAAHVFNRSVEIGQYVLERFFNNDLALAGSKNRYKPVSYQRIREMNEQSSGVSDNPAIAMKKHLTRVERWIRGVAAPAGMTSKSVVGGLAPADREALLNSAGGILEDMSVITNAIQQMVSILIEIQAAPEIEGPGSEAA